jgi:hypothetical protein
MKFKIHQYADVGTGALKESDLPLLHEDAPNCFTSYPQGAIFWTPLGDSEEAFEQLKIKWINYGFSQDFVAIMTAATNQGIPYVRFDADGEEPALEDGQTYHSLMNELLKNPQDALEIMSKIERFLKYQNKLER